MTSVIYGDRLRQARVLRYEKLGDIAELLECTSSALSKWERAELVQLSPLQLTRLANRLRFPYEFFRRSPGAPLSEADLLFKAPKSTLKREKDFLREFIRFISELIVWLDSRRQLPPVAIRPRQVDSISMVEIARDVRESIGISPFEPIDFLTHPIERAGIVVAVRRRKIAEIALDADDPPMPRERHEGCSTWVGEFRERPLIVMRAVDTWEKTRWVLSHELGHLILHAGRMPVTEGAEEEASQFASEFLAPIDAITEDLPRTVTLAALIKLKLRWGISIAALIRHLHHNDVISDQRKQTLYAQLYTRRNPETGRSYGVTEPGWDARTPERPRLIAAWLGHTIGSAIPEIVSHSSEIWPADLLSEVITEQRPAPVRVRNPQQERQVPEKRGRVIPMPLRHQGDTRQAR